MALGHSPKIVTDKLVCCIDSANKNKGFIRSTKTNLIRNGDCTGSVNGVIGSGGSLPTNWAVFQNPVGISIEVVGSGVEDGISYVDIRISGTSTTNMPLIAFDTALTTQINTTYTNSAWFKLVSGTYTESISFALTNAGGYSGKGVVFIDSTLTRYCGSGNTGATTPTTPWIQINVTLGVAQDFTIRIGGVQLEEGFGTQYIPTTNGTSSATNISGVVDLVGKNTFTADSFMFNDNVGKFEFGKTSQFADKGLILSGTLESLMPTKYVYSYEAIFKISFPITWGEGLILGRPGFNNGLIVGNSNSFKFGHWRQLDASWTPVSVSNPSALTSDIWYHVVGTWNVYSAMKLYINGVLIGQTILSPYNPDGYYNNQLAIRIGGTVAGTRYNFMGEVAVARVYAKELSAAEVAQNFDALRGRYGL